MSLAAFWTWARILKSFSERVIIYLKGLTEQPEAMFSIPRANFGISRSFDEFGINGPIAPSTAARLRSFIGFKLIFTLTRTFRGLLLLITSFLTSLTYN